MGRDGRFNKFITRPGLAHLDGLVVMKSLDACWKTLSWDTVRWNFRAEDESILNHLGRSHTQAEMARVVIPSSLSGDSCPY